MQVVILCGGQGTRLREETEFRPKPMVEVGGRPILWHIMKLYAHHGLRQLRALPRLPGQLHQGLFPELRVVEQRLHDPARQPTADHLPRRPPRAGLPGHPGRHRAGDDDRRPGPAGRALRRRRDLHGHLRRRRRRRRPHARCWPSTTATANSPPSRRIQPSSRFGLLEIDEEQRVRRFAEKPKVDGWASAGFFVFNRRLFDYLDGDECVLEQKPLERLAAEGQLMVYKHDGLLLRDGHLSRVPDAQRDVGPRRGAVEGLGRRGGSA